MSAVIAALVAAIHVFVDPRDKPAGDGVEVDHHSKPQPGTDDEITFQRPISAAC